VFEGLPRFRVVRRGYRAAMTAHPHQPGSDEADPEKQTTPAGVARDLEDEAEEAGASTKPDEPQQKPPKDVSG